MKKISDIWEKYQKIELIGSNNFSNVYKAKSKLTNESVAIKEIKRPHLRKDEIKWIVTIPAIWSEYEKNIMMEASIDSGLIDKNSDKSLFFAIEPEAALLYC